MRCVGLRDGHDRVSSVFPDEDVSFSDPDVGLLGILTAGISVVPVLLSATPVLSVVLFHPTLGLERGAPVLTNTEEDVRGQRVVFSDPPPAVWHPNNHGWERR